MEALYKKYAFPSASRFYEILKENGLKVSHSAVKEFVNNQAVAQIHKPVKHVVAQQRNITASEPNEIWQIDLLDYHNYNKQNKGYNWILIAVDFFTRKAYAEPIKSKTPTNTLEAFKKMIHSGTHPKLVYFDEGSEWKGVFGKFIKDENIGKMEQNSRNHHSFAIIDRFSRTIKTMIAKNMTGNDNVNWVNELQHLVSIYNNSSHAGIDGIKPNKAETKENLLKIGNINWVKDMKNQKIIQKEHKFKVGDNVRIKIMKQRFDKGYTATYSKTVHIVVSVLNEKIQLDDGKNYLAKDLKLVPSGSSSVNGGVQKKADKNAVVKRKLQREGLI